MGAVLLCNVALMATTVALLGPKGMFTVRVIVLTWSFFPISLVAISVRNRHIVMACLIWLIALYPLAAIWH